MRLLGGGPSGDGGQAGECLGWVGAMTICMVMMDMIYNSCDLLSMINGQWVYCHNEIYEPMKKGLIEI